LNKFAFGGAGIVAIGLSGVLAFTSVTPAPAAAAPAPSASVSLAPSTTGTASVRASDSLAAKPDTTALVLGDGKTSPNVAMIASTIAGNTTGKSVRFGVVLIAYVGAQGASEKTRSRDAAQQLAVKLAEEAAKDFHSAVVKGDTGSTDDAGRIDRGVLEAQTETVLFALSAGQTSGPIETPRGFWIVKRTE
jgi:PPIC-type PPIASE domain